MRLQQLFLKMTAYYAGDPHQIQHFTKVHGFARQIGLAEGLDGKTLETLEAAAIVHDIGIKPALEKYGSSGGKYQELEGTAPARAMLEELGYPPDIVERVCYLVGRHHTYSGIDGPDYRILVEADFLVNLHEWNGSREAVGTALSNIFKTAYGTELCTLMFADRP